MSLKTKRTVIEVKLYFEGRYIADPYVPAMDEVIDIAKKSGLNRLRSEAKRSQALKGYLESEGMTMEDYERLQEEAKQAWYRRDNKPDGEIVVSSHQFYGMLVAAADKLSSGFRPCEPPNIRHFLKVTDFGTGKKHADGIWARFARLKSGTGQSLSNQPALRKNEYIEDFTATGTIGFFRDDIHRPETLGDFLEYAGQRVGVGGCRPMDCGRFTVESMEVVDDGGVPLLLTR